MLLIKFAWGIISVNTAHDGGVNGLCFTADGQRLLSVGTDSRLRVWSAATGVNSLVNFGAVPNRSRRAVQLAVSTGARPELAYVPTRDSIAVYGVQDGRRRATLRGHYGTVTACAACPHSQVGWNNTLWAALELVVWLIK